MQQSLSIDLRCFLALSFYFIFALQVISIFTVIGLVFIPVGLASLFASERVIINLSTHTWYMVWNGIREVNKLIVFEQGILMQVVEVPFRYDDKCLPRDYRDNAVAYIKDDRTNKTCTRKWTVSTLQFLISPYAIGNEVMNWFGRIFLLVWYDMII